MNNVIFMWNMAELCFESKKIYANPYMDVFLRVDFFSPQGTKYTVPAFWDGDLVWKARFSPNEEGLWKWESYCSDCDNDGLHGKKGEFLVSKYEGENPVYKHGFLKVSNNHRGFCYADGTEFFWLGDTVWSAPSRATVDEWEQYVKKRSEQGFNVVQVNALPQHDCSGDENDYRLPFEKGKIVLNLERLNVEYFKYMDKLMDLTVRHGMFTAMVVLWFDYVPGTNPLWSVSRKADFSPILAEHYAKYLAARYAAYGIIWIISGDSDFENKYSISVYHAAAKAIKESCPYGALTTAHLNGGLFTPDSLNEKSWLDFHMFQSSHNDQSHKAALHYAVKDRQLLPPRPVLNGEPAYENIGYWMKNDRIDRYFVRKTAWFSILGGGNAGITYGAHGLWSWHREGEMFYPADAWQMPEAWNEAIKFPGACDYAEMKNFMQNHKWWELEPLDNNVRTEKETEVACAHNDEVLIVYLSKPDIVYINSTIISVKDFSARWFEPSNGNTADAEAAIVDGEISFDAQQFVDDVVLVVFK